MKLPDIDLTLLNSLSPAEREYALKILNELSETGKSALFQELWDNDYEEIPVSMDRFLDDDMFMGKATLNGKKVFPLWRQTLNALFSLNSPFNECILSGAIGIGKTTTAILGMVYTLYRLMCLRNPHQYYNLIAGSKIIFSFFNVNLDLSYGVAYDKLQGMLLQSKWFLDHGTVIGKKNLEYVPSKDIEFKVGSQEQHTLGQDIFCLEGQTKIVTSQGVFPIESLCNQKIRVLSIDNSSNLVLSNPCFVVKSGDASMLYRLTLLDGSQIQCTPNHQFLLTNGQYVEASKLRIGDDLHHIYETLQFKQNLNNILSEVN